ncbi:HAMP domain-containing histidine kinase [Lutibacter sp. B1]|nr:HAMP domain-containing histidine kinase [Lutibacter sp. B1]
MFTTIAVQVYWNYKNYQLNKNRIVNEIQISFDNSIEEYYAELAKANYITIIDNDSLSTANHFFEDVAFDSIFNESRIKKTNSKKQKFSKNKRSENTEIKINTEESKNNLKFDSLFINITEETNKRTQSTFPINNDTITKFTNLNDDETTGYTFDKKNKTVSKVTVIRGKKAADSIKLLKGLKTLFVSINKDTIEYEKLDSLLQKQLQQKNINLEFAIHHLKKDTLFYYSNNSITTKNLVVNSKSTYIKPNNKLQLYFKNPSTEILKRSVSGILISLLLSLAIISSLFYLLYIIKNQKQLAEIKNDLISNITHELKTPITTISTALEALKNFNALEDKTKTENYISIANAQVTKLNVMVEKILETATLNQEELSLNKEPIDIHKLLKNCINKYQVINPEKKIIYKNMIDSTLLNLDKFHFENAISNIIDNALKYGGNKICIELSKTKNSMIILFKDNGNGIPKNQKEKIFEQFYRIPTGDTHNVKGFGIGLYYTKNIIEKHNGNITVIYDKKNKTVFKIELLNE